MTDGRALRALGSACLAVGALAWAWSFFATQAPGSRWHLPGAPGAVDALALRAWVTGLACLVLAPQVATRTSWLRATALAGTSLSLVAHGATAATGWLGVQLLDARGGARAILVARVIGGVLQLIALTLGLRALRRVEA
ncbi:MAG: hypothetical protein U0325_04520 [Polyangiales bacterium]